MKKYFRCIICGDTHYGDSYPKECPTCMQNNVYVKIEAKEFFIITKAKELEKHNELKDEWEYEDVKENFTKLCDDNNTFMLNPDKEHTDMILNGIIGNQKNKGLKLCPCRMQKNEDWKEKMELICPCNFYSHDVYKEKKRNTKQCWCGLFVKK